MLNAGRNVKVPQAPGGPHAGKNWGDYVKELDAADADVHLTLPLAECARFMVADGTEDGAYKTAQLKYVTERKSRRDKQKKGKGGSNILAGADNDE